MVSKVTNLSDARYCAGMGVEMIGFDIRPGSTSYIDPLRFQEITGWVAGVKLVGEVEGLAEDVVRQQTVKYPLDYLLISDATLVRPLESVGVPLIVTLSPGEDIEKTVATLTSSENVAYLLLETTSPEGIDWHVFGGKPLLVGYDIGAEDAQLLAENPAVSGIALKGSEEIKPGYKDYDELSEILDALEAED